MRTDVKNSRGQATVILGMAAAVVDADAAALTGATALPESSSDRSVPLGD
jgi:hypothetical protein